MSPEQDAESRTITVRPIGFVEGGGDDLARVDWSRVRSRVRVRDELAGALHGLDGYSHVIVVGWLDRYPPELRERRAAHPAGDERLPLQGSFALRGARPNPIAVTVCRLREIDGAVLHLEGLDLVDGTPVLDVKPYIAFYDAVAEATLPRWARG